MDNTFPLSRTLKPDHCTKPLCSAEHSRGNY
uniref:Uncharacterized protein n=1 Tax=Anguilla anguilla TaxID=7936 RepID=A0A0E9PQT0_ANGAN